MRIKCWWRSFQFLSVRPVPGTRIRSFVFPEKYGIDLLPVPGCSISFVSVCFSVALNLIRSAESKDNTEIWNTFIRKVYGFYIVFPPLGLALVQGKNNWPAKWLILHPGTDSRSIPKISSIPFLSSWENFLCLVLYFFWGRVWCIFFFHSRHSMEVVVVGWMCPGQKNISVFWFPSRWWIGYILMKRRVVCW